MQQMTTAEWRAFVMDGSRTGKLATVRADGRPHAVPIWFMLEGEDLLFMTGSDTVKARNLRQNNKVTVVVDDESFPFSFVSIEGEATLHVLAPTDLLPYSIEIARRYVGVERAEEFGRRNAVAGELLVRVHPTKVISAKDLAD
ncbi:MAG: PPOX class F420-dependent oxidoreductase [Caldilineaceae bacterium]|nr:PPOX class F420-dependent oxidoreductase [Caldilineaceae bacterium]